MTLSKDVQRLLDQRYLQPGEDWNGLVKRVVDHVCEGESNWYKQEVTEHLTRRIWLPNSPCLVGSGTKTGGLFACFVVGPDEDTLEHHVEVLGDIAAVGKRGGGCGFSGTNIRPEGSPVAGSAHGSAYGPNNWAIRVSDYLEMITQGNFRRMALMYSVRSDHPDLTKFINLKHNKDERFAHNFNQSVMATDEWMNEAIKKNDEKRLQLIQIAKNAWNNGEPGLLFHTTINENTPYKTCGCKIETTNPCFAPWTPIRTRHGLKRIDELVGKSVEIWNGENWVIVDNFRITAKDQKIMSIILSNNERIDLTPYHKMILEDGKIVEAKELKVGDYLKTTNTIDDEFLSEKISVVHINEPDGSRYDVYCCTEHERHEISLGAGIQTAQCGEQPIPSYGSCNLGSISISHEYFYDNGNFDYSRLSRVVAVITRFLDNVGSKNIFPNKKFQDWYENHRPIGIGIMGYADALLKLKLKYGEQQGLDFLDSVMNVIQKVSYSTSTQLGEERGIPSHCEVVGRRNITTVSIAPTGSIGFIAECSHGIEPIFSPVYQRTDERGETYLFSHPLRKEPYFVSCLNDDKAKIPTWKQHIDVQATVQRNCDSAVSKTINMSNDATVQDVLDAFVYAWKSGCKGITVYRDGSRQFQVLEDVKEEDSLLQDCPTGICEL